MGFGATDACLTARPEGNRFEQRNVWQCGDAEVSSAPGKPCGIARRLAAVLYDALLILALWMIGTLPLVIATGSDIGSGHWLFRIYLAALALGYLHLSWSRSGQTLGMRAWRIELRAWRRSPASLISSVLRLGVGLISIAALGLGFISAQFRSDRATWHDRASGTRLVVRGNGRAPESGISAVDG